MIYVKTTSHRARHRLQQRLDRKPINYISLRTEGEWHELQPGEDEKVKGIKGCTIVQRIPKDLMKPWSF